MEGGEEHPFLGGEGGPLDPPDQHGEEEAEVEEVGDEGQLGLGVLEEVGCFGGFREVGGVVYELEQSYNDCYKNSRNC